MRKNNLVLLKYTEMIDDIWQSTESGGSCPDELEATGVRRAFDSWLSPVVNVRGGESRFAS